VGGRNITSDSELDFGIFIKQIIPNSLAAKDGKDAHTKLNSHLIPRPRSLDKGLARSIPSKRVHNFVATQDYVDCRHGRK